MKRMKKYLCVLLAGVMIMGLCACGKTSSGKSKKDDDDDRGRDRKTERVEDDEDDKDEEDHHGRDKKSDDDETEETRGRKFYEEGGIDGEECYYLIDDKTPEEIVELYVYYRDTLDELGFKDRDLLRDYLLVEPEDFDSDDNGNILITYSGIVDDPIDHVKDMYVSGFGLINNVEISMTIEVYDHDRAMAIIEAFKDHYNVGGADVVVSDVSGVYDGGYRIDVDEYQSYWAAYKEREFEGVTYYVIDFDESKG